MYLTKVLEDGQLAAIHAKRVTLMAKDISLALRLRGDENKDFISREDTPGNFFSLPYRGGALSDDEKNTILQVIRKENNMRKRNNE